MRILYITTKSEIGGAQVHIFQLSKYFVEKENEVAVMAYPGGWLEQKSKELGVKFYPNIFFSNSFNPFLGLKMMKVIKKAILDFQPDLVACHSTAAGFWGRLALRQTQGKALRQVRQAHCRQAQGKPSVIFTAHGWGFTQGVSILRKSGVILAEKIASLYCQKIICVSDFDRNLALKYKIAKPDKLIVIHNGVEIISVNQRIDQRKSALIKIVFVGRLAEPKDPLLLVMAFSELPQEVKAKSEILIIGEGEKRKELEDFIKKNELEGRVRLLGSFPGGKAREKVFQVLRESDIFVLTSKYEGFPITILEAMAFGLPVVASNVGGVGEALRQVRQAHCKQAQGKPVGYLVERGDKEALKKALIELIENPDLREKMGQNARKRAEEEFSLEKMLKETEKVYNMVIDKN